MDATELLVELGDLIGEFLSEEADADFVKVKPMGTDMIELVSDRYRINLQISEVTR